MTNTEVIRQGIAGIAAQVARSSDAEQTLRLLVELRDLTSLLTDLMAVEVKAQGYSWEHVGDLTGITRQGAQQRWG